MRRYRGPLGWCDRCEGRFYLSEVQPQRRAAGATLVPTGWLVCRECMDVVDVKFVRPPLDDPSPIFPPGHGSKP